VASPFDLCRRPRGENYGGLRHRLQKKGKVVVERRTEGSLSTSSKRNIVGCARID